MTIRRQPGPIDHRDYEPPWPPYYESGFAMDGPTATQWEVNIGIGSARTHTTPGTTDNTGNGVLDSAFTKKLDGAAWAAGSGSSGLADGADAQAANAWYATFLMTKGMNSTSSADVGFDSDTDGANLIADSVVVAAGFDHFRFIGWVQIKSDISDVRPFFYNPDSGLWLYREARDLGSYTSTHTFTLELPEGNLDVLLRAAAYGSSDEGAFNWHHRDSSDAADGNSENYKNWGNWQVSGAATDAGTGTGIVRADTDMKVDFDVAGDAPVACEQSLYGFFVKRSDR